MWDTWHAMCHVHGSFEDCIRGFSWVIRTSKGEQQEEGEGREKRKGGKEKRKGGTKEKKKKEEERKKKEEKEGVSHSEQTQTVKNSELRNKG